MKMISNKIISLLILVSLMYLSFFSIFLMSKHHHTPIQDCPYMIGGSVCAMNLFEHLTSWKSLITTLPSVIFILFLFVFVYFFFQIFSNSSPPILRQLLYYKKSKFKDISSKIEIAFADGVLNPKPY